MKKLLSFIAVLALMVAISSPMMAQTNPTQTVSANALSSGSNGTSGYLPAWFSPSGATYPAYQLMSGNVTNPAYLLTLSLGGASTLTLPSAGTYAFSGPGTIITAASPLPGANGGTGVANTGFTITLAGNLVTSGAFNTTFTQQGTTTVTLPTTSSTMARTDAGQTFTGNETFSGVLSAGSGPTTLTDATGKILAAALNTVTIGVGGTGIANVNTQTVTTAGTQILAGAAQAQTDVAITGMTTAGVCVATLVAAPGATWQTGITILTQAKSGACTVWLVNGTSAPITPAAQALNVRGIL